MKKLIIGLALGALVGCGSMCAVIDINNNDTYGYRVLPWENDDEENAAARARYYVWGARTQYPTGQCHRVEILLYEEGKEWSDTNVMKRAHYWVWGEKK